MNTAKSGKTKTAAKSVRSAKKSAKTAKIPAGQTLVVVESPAKAKTIEKYLGKNYMVRASMGHLRDLPQLIWKYHLFILTIRCMNIIRIIFLDQDLLKLEKKLRLRLVSFIAKNVMP